MDLTQFAMASFVVIGLVNGIQLLVDGDWKSFAKFAIAVVSAVAFGYFKWFGLTSPEVGFAVGVASSGVYKVAQRLGGQ